MSFTSPVPHTTQVDPLNASRFALYVNVDGGFTKASVIDKQQLHVFPSVLRYIPNWPQVAIHVEPENAIPVAGGKRSPVSVND
jgi:hypothetical protein